jgi:hypothetical protein
MTLTPSDMLAIQTAIDAYENRFPNRPSPSAEEALAWRVGTPWDRLLLWWHVVVMPRIRPVFFPKRADDQVKNQKNLYLEAPLTRDLL